MMTTRTMRRGGAEGELVLLEFLNFPLLIVNIGVLTSIGMERERETRPT